MILAIKTDTALLELALIDSHDSTKVRERNIELGRSMARDILSHIEALLSEAAIKWPDLTGLIVFSGPGSFTGLRIGATTANTIAYAESLPIVGMAGDNWREQGVARLKGGENDTMVMPRYGKPANITSPRK
ncbi:MAG TPA: tRNA (adenosine(37)-N6)-threonylcarbamoyltransferase complex dimerization subunit type 1 TsaB [Candidatus Saccharimonadales bacterium]